MELSNFFAFFRIQRPRDVKRALQSELETRDEREREGCIRRLLQRCFERKNEKRALARCQCRCRCRCRCSSLLMSVSPVSRLKVILSRPRLPPMPTPTHAYNRINVARRVDDNLATDIWARVGTLTNQHQVMNRPP